MAGEHEGATANERLLAAAKEDNEELLLEVFENPEGLDINFTDGLGNTALHYAAKCGSTTVLEHLLSYEGCDVDIQNRLEGNTPLHMAVKNSDDPALRNHIVESLLEAGADTRVRDKNGDVIYDIISSDSKDLDDKLRAAIRREQAMATVGADFADDDDETGSGSETD